MSEAQLEKLCHKTILYYLTLNYFKNKIWFSPRCELSSFREFSFGFFFIFCFVQLTLLRKGPLCLFSMSALGDSHKSLSCPRLCMLKTTTGFFVKEGSGSSSGFSCTIWLVALDIQKGHNSLCTCCTLP